MPHATAKDGVKLYYEAAGSGTPLVFIHEFAGDYRSWEPQMRFSRAIFAASPLTRAAFRPPTCRRIRRAIPRPTRATTSSRCWII